ncbi:MAG: formylglycine-generating enzyme family protein [Candidatus Poribacteria bacterium]|nr:formylglycine-generating enzyme family protein [Candidatus Poribacteria bacterium]
MKIYCYSLFLIVLCIGLIACSNEDNPEHPIQPDAQTNHAVIDVEEMVLIPAGEVTIGTDEKTDLTFGNEVDSQVVFVEAFYIDKYEVTNGQYAKFLSETGHRTPKFWDNPTLNAPDQPVVGVNWEDAEIYSRWAGKRLPTDVEWEKAARSPDGRLYPWGDGFDASLGNFDDGEQMNGKLDGYAMETAPVGSFAKGISPYGLHDMSGNVWEWVISVLDDSTLEAHTKELTNGKIYTIRGGSWTNGPGDTRSTVFYIYPAQCSDHSSSVGFRCAKTP